MSRATLEVHMLGELTVVRDGEPVVLPQSKKTRALLAYLILSGRPQRRERICSLLWDVADDPRGALRWCLSKLRSLVNDADAVRIQTEGSRVWFEPEGVDIDVVSIRTALSAGLERCDDQTLIDIVARHRGELLEGLDMSDFGEFHAWCLAEREECRARLATVLRELLSRLRSRPADALPYARALVGIDPIDERVRADLVLLLAEAGRATEAEEHVHIAERQLRELGVEPSGPLDEARRIVARTRGGGSRPAPSPSLAASPPPEQDVRGAGESLIGRDSERDRLASLAAAVRREHRERVVLIGGEPGIGKTRLLVDLLDGLREQGVAILEGRAFEAERGRPYGPWIDALRRSFAAGAAADPLAPLLSDTVGENAAPSRVAMFAAIVELIAGEAERAGLVVLALDDVQWLDEASAELLHFAARKSRTMPLLVAMTARSGELIDNAPLQSLLRGLRRESLIDEVELGPLAAAETEQLIGRIAPTADAARLFAQSGGNPLFALELARSGDSDTPRTLTEVVRERVDRLPAEAGDLLRWAAVIGPKAPVARLETLSALATSELIGGLELLERHRLLIADGEVYGFAHEVVRQVVYGQLSEPRRRLMHRRIVQELEQTSDAADLVHHAILAGDPEAAARACVGGGRRSLRLFANRDAAALARRGASYAAELDDPQRTCLGIELWEVRLAAEGAGDPAAATREIETLADHALELGELEHARLGFHMLGYLRWETDSSRDAARYMMQAEQLTRGASGSQRAAALAEAARCLVLLDRDLAQAEAFHLEARALAAHLSEEPAEVAVASGMLLLYRGEHDAAAAAFEGAVQMARRGQDRLGEYGGLEQLVTLELHRGDLDAAAAHVERLEHLGERLRQGSEGPNARALAAAVAHGRGDPEADDRFEAAVVELREVDAKQRLGFALLAAAAVDLGTGAVAAARARAGAGLEIMARLGRRSDTVWARALLVAAAEASGDAEEAAEHRRLLAGTDLTGVAAHARDAARAVLEP